MLLLLVLSIFILYYILLVLLLLRVGRLAQDTRESPYYYIYMMLLCYEAYHRRVNFRGGLFLPSRRTPGTFSIAFPHKQRRGKSQFKNWILIILWHADTQATCIFLYLFSYYLVVVIWYMWRVSKKINPAAEHTDRKESRLLSGVSTHPLSGGELPGITRPAKAARSLRARSQGAGEKR